jgi:hypothetical protein
MVYACLSVLFSLLSWGEAETKVQVPGASQGLLLHVLKHLAFGVVAALPSRRLSLIVASGVAVLVMDVDHLGSALDLPTVSHAGHSLGFAALLGGVIWGLARRGFLGGVSPILVSAVAVASVSAHVAIDALSIGRHLPLWAPATFTAIEIPRLSAVPFELGAVLLVWAASIRYNRRPIQTPPVAT